jgi:hypothetical protein
MFEGRQALVPERPPTLAEPGPEPIGHPDDHAAQPMPSAAPARTSLGNGRRYRPSRRRWQRRPGAHQGSASIKPEARWRPPRRHWRRDRRAWRAVCPGRPTAGFQGQCRPGGVGRWHVSGGDQQRFAEDHHRDGEEEAGAEARRAAPEQEGGADDAGSSTSLGSLSTGISRSKTGLLRTG